MIRSPQIYLLLYTIIAVLAFEMAASKMPYEVVDSMLELSDRDPDFKDLTRVNVSDDRGRIRPIYRLDLDPDYVAYYEIDIGSDYVVLSSSKKTGDFRKVESGPDPRPTDVLIQQAEKNDQRCDKFYRLSPMGLTICKNDNGTVVAASYDWTADVAEIEDWRQLDQMVKRSFDGFKRQWQERAVHRRSKSDWATTNVFPKGKGKKEEEIDEEALSPGSITRLALGESFKSVYVYITNIGNLDMRPSSRSAWQQKLCKVLVDVCLPDGGTKVNPSAIKEAPNQMLYLKLEVHSKLSFVGNVLQWREIGFVVKINEGKNEVVKKHFAVNLHSKRIRRSSGGGSTSQGSIVTESYFPDYNQHICCGGCHSGCSPVAWAQVFGYYDRRASLSSRSIYSPNIYGDSNTVAPMGMTRGVERFVEDIRSRVQTFCTGDQGSTYSSKMHLIAPWFRARQGSKSRVVSYLKNRKKRSSGGGASVHRAGASWIEAKGVWWIKNYRYPVVFGFRLDSKSGHSVVATKYKETTRRYRHCYQRKTGWWMGRRTVTVCSWKTAYDYEFFLHYGWGGSNNKWQEVSPTSAHVAYIVK